jgi:hypothetical protein
VPGSPPCASACPPITGRRFSTLTPSWAQALVLHYTTAAETVTWESVASHHVQSRGFAGIGHHVGVRNGEIAYLGDLDSEYAVPAIRDAIQRRDLGAVHLYAHMEWGATGDKTLPGGIDSYWHMLRAWRPQGFRKEPGRPADRGGYLAQFSHQPYLITEAGTFAHHDQHRTEQTLLAMRRLLSRAADDGRCLGVTWFIWSTDEAHPTNNIGANPALRTALAGLEAYETSARVPVTGTGGSAMETRFWAILERRAKAVGVGVDDLRGKLLTGGRFGALTPAHVEAVAVHHTAAPETTTWEAVAEYHVRSRGFAGVGYDVGIRNGRIAYLGDLDTARAHVANENHRYLGLCMAGNYETAQPSEANMKALKVAYEAMCEWLGRNVPARPHRDLAPPGYTVCSGRNLIARLGELTGAASGNLEQALLKWADVGQSIQPNEAAAIYKSMRQDGYWPLSDESGARGEVPAVAGHPGIVAQLGREWKGQGERVYFWDGRPVGWVARRT